MAKTPVSDEELQLKKKARRRLVGAVVLVLLVVVFVPMFLDRGPRPQKQDIDIRIPPIPGQQAAPPAASVPPAPQPSAAAPPPASSSEKPPTMSAAEPTTTKESQPTKESAAPQPEVIAPPAPKPAPAAKPAAAAKAAPAQSASKESQSESFVIQVGAFSDPANARHLVEKLKAEKIPAYTEPVKTPQGEKTRVRAGPYPTLAAAEHGRTRLKTLKVTSGDAKIVHKGE